MDQNYIDIEAHIRHAQQLRSEALGALISSGLERLKRFLARFQHGHIAAVPPSFRRIA